MYSHLGGQLLHLGGTDLILKPGFNSGTGTNLVAGIAPCGGVIDSLFNKVDSSSPPADTSNPIDIKYKKHADSKKKNQQDFLLQRRKTRAPAMVNKTKQQKLRP